MTLENQSQITPRRPIFLGYLLSAVATAMVVLLLLALAVTHIVDVSFVSEAACRRFETTSWYSSFTYCFYGSDWDQSTYLAAVSGFYSTIIAVLIAVQALVSGLAFVFVRSTNRRSIEDAVEVQLPAYFGTVKALNTIKKIVDEVSADAVPNAVKQSTADIQDKLSDLEGNFYGLQGEYESLKAVVAKLNDEDPDEEDVEGNGIITQ